MKGTPDSERLHIVLLGERNSGKSSLLNAIAGQQVAIVSDIPGTTTDTVSKAMELPGIGACVLIDTAGLDDIGELGGKRIGKAMDSIRGADILIAVADATTEVLPDIPASGIPVIPVINKSDVGRAAPLAKAAAIKYGKEAVAASALKREGVDEIISAIRENIPEGWNAALLTEGIVDEGGLALLVMPQDSQAPKGRLILPQQQVIRELLDRGCRVVCCTPDTLERTLGSLEETPDAIITDSQALRMAASMKPAGTRLSSFSMLLAAAKGDMDYFRKSAGAIDKLDGSSRVLIAEACTHVPASEDIGRVQIPRLLRSRAGESLQVDVVSGRDFPEDLRGYDLIIHCGACMFNRRYVLARVRQAKEQGVPMTNYGVTIAYINNLL